MTEHDFLAMIADKYGLPGAVIAAVLWLGFRFGWKPTGTPITNETAAAINKLSDKMDGMSKEVSQMNGRLIRVETKMEDKR